MMLKQLIGDDSMATVGSALHLEAEAVERAMNSLPGDDETPAVEDFCPATGRGATRTATISSTP